MKKFLMIATVPSMIGQFNMRNIHLLQKMGYDVHVACNFKDRSVWTEENVKDFERQLSELHIKKIQIEFARSPYDVSKLVKSYVRLHRIFKEQKYDMLHCHTPVAGMIARLVAKGTKAKVIYTAHGFHFFKGAPLKNWLIYYPIEKICSYMTDVLITINKEDYRLAKNKMHAKHIRYVPGVGIDLKKFGTLIVDKKEKRREYGIPENATLFVSVGELNENKNHETVIRAITEMPDIYYIIAGKGKLQNHLQILTNEFGMAERVKLLGFRQDIGELCEVADAFVFPSFQEGLPVSLMEAMASGCPVVCSNIRGNTDLIDENGGELFNPHSIAECQNGIKKILTRELDELSKYNKKRIREFEVSSITKMMEEIYRL